MEEDEVKETVEGKDKFEALAKSRKPMMKKWLIELAMIPVIFGLFIGGIFLVPRVLKHQAGVIAASVPQCPTRTLIGQ
jgi:hypothetical protein